ncbi:MAG: restriction endonuclease subunit S [Chitinophagaceae bacterium]
MESDFVNHKLSDVLTQYRIKTFINDKERYRQVTITNDGTVRLRGEKTGKSIGRKRQFTVDLKQHPNTIIFIRQTIKDGGIGLASKDINGCVVTENFPMFDINKSKVLPEFLFFYFRCALFKQELNKITARGTAQKAIHEDLFINLSIPLPILSIQQSIVNKLTALKSKLELIQKLKLEQQRDFIALQNCIFNELLEQKNKIPIGEILIEGGKVCKIKNTEFYKQVTVSMEHKGVSLRKLIKGNEIGSLQTKAKAGNFIISKIDARMAPWALFRQT